MTRNLPINTALFLVAASLSWGCVTSEPSDAGPGDEQEQTSDPDTATDLSPQDIDLPEDQTEATPLPDSTSDIVFLDTLEDEDEGDDSGEDSLEDEREDEAEETDFESDLGSDPNLCEPDECGGTGGECSCNESCLVEGNCCENACEACGLCPAVCGDGACAVGEDSCDCTLDCPADPWGCDACECGGSGGLCACDEGCLLRGDCCDTACSVCGECDNQCGNGLCEEGETPCSCSSDCANDPTKCEPCECGDAGGPECYCDPSCLLVGDCCLDSCTTCGACDGECGNGVCESEETCGTCASDCGACEGSCCLAHESPGCNKTAVMPCVCAAIPACCAGLWTEECAAQADSCGSCNGSCCGANATPGCADEQVEACVCEKDLFCCNAKWDATCVELATSACEACQPYCGDGMCDEYETCATCLVDCQACQGSCCLEKSDAGCAEPTVQACVCQAMPSCCEESWSAECALKAEACGSCGGACCEAHEGPGCAEQGVEACVCAVDAGCCLGTWDSVCLGLAATHCGACAGAAECGDAICQVNESCTDCPADCGLCGDSCCQAHPEAGCGIPSVTECVCGQVPECCTGTWTQECVLLASSCGQCDGDCCAAHAGQGCVDLEVTACVCELDAGCCALEWDEVCAALAGTCGASCSTAQGCTPQPTPGCGGCACEACVCAADSYCCDNEWDISCVDSCQFECGGC